MAGPVRRSGPRARLTVLAAAFGGLVPSGCAPHTAKGAPSGGHGLALEGPWTRATTATWDANGAPTANGAVYLRITNTGAQADTLTGVGCGAAQVVEVHRSFTEDGVMRMRPAGDVEVPAHGRVVLEPGGLHIMLIGLERDLKEGEELPVTVHFARAGAIGVRAEVRPRTGAMAPMGMAASEMATGTPSPAARAGDLYVVIPPGTAAAQMRGEGGVAIPPSIELVAGGAVVIRNDDNAMHYFFSMPIAPGQTARKEFATPGRYTYTSILSCSVAGLESVSVQVRPR